jgi:hypothetical protein
MHVDSSNHPPSLAARTTAKGHVDAEHADKQTSSGADIPSLHTEACDRPFGAKQIFQGALEGPY